MLTMAFVLWVVSCTGTTQRVPDKAGPSAPEVHGSSAFTSSRPLQAPPTVSVFDDVTDEGLHCLKIVTPSATYFYDKSGAGFSSLLDQDGRDWIGYHPEGGPQGHFRGIPNMAFQRFGHPGSDVKPGIETVVELESPEHVRIASRSADRSWHVTWDIFPDRADMTVVRAGGLYWWLYEGTPGGAFDPGRDYYVRSTDQGQRRSASETFETDIQGAEWIYFGDPELRRVLLVVNHQDDAYPDRYFPMDGMTVFGFGRGEGVRDYFSEAPARFTLSLVPTDEPEAVATMAQEILDRAQVEIP